jgi:hypothetical protein
VHTNTLIVYCIPTVHVNGYSQSKDLFEISEHLFATAISLQCTVRRGFMLRIIITITFYIDYVINYYTPSKFDLTFL